MHCILISILMGNKRGLCTHCVKQMLGYTHSAECVCKLSDVSMPGVSLELHGLS